MGIETSVANKKVKQVGELAKDKIPIPNSNLNPKTNTNSKGKRGRRRHHKKMVAVSPFQKLFNTCNEVFDSCSTGIIPSSDNIQKLKAVLGMFLYVQCLKFDILELENWVALRGFRV
jgi:cysteamine dioxygenase